MSSSHYPRSFVSAALSLLLLAGALSAAAPGYAQNAQNSAAANRPRSVAVSGQGEVQAEPDRALVMLGVQVRLPKLEEARGEVNKKIDAVLKLTRELKIDPKYVRSTRISIQPEYSYENNARNLLGYLVWRQVEVDLRSLEQLGQLMERAADLGVNQLGTPQLDSSKRAELEREAMAKAVADARLNAEALVKAAGARLGAVRTLSASSNAAAPPMPMMRMQALTAEAADASQSYQSGQMNFTAAVQIEYDLLVDGGQ
ncbi:MAG: SIMPL domain-containing protein [Gammaproteobacteria bacterium]|nr:SIMPL domain-containing protein [Gammaproteobacteria bacterium]